MPLSARIFKCANCGIELDRDFNASLNLECWQTDINYPKTVSSTGLACEESHQLDGIAVEDSAKQEENIKSALSRFE